MPSLSDVCSSSAVSFLLTVLHVQDEPEHSVTNSRIERLQSPEDLPLLSLLCLESQLLDALFCDELAVRVLQSSSQPLSFIVSRSPLQTTLLFFELFRSLSTVDAVFWDVPVWLSLFWDVPVWLSLFWNVPVWLSLFWYVPVWLSLSTLLGFLRLSLPFSMDDWFVLLLGLSLKENFLVKLLRLSPMVERAFRVKASDSKLVSFTASVFGLLSSFALLWMVSLVSLGLFASLDSSLCELLSRVSGAMLCGFFMMDGFDVFWYTISLVLDIKSVSLK